MKVTSLVKELKDPCTSENEHPKKNGQFELADETEKSWGDDSKPKGWVACWFSIAMRHNDANKMTPHPLPYASFPEFWQNR